MNSGWLIFTGTLPTLLVMYFIFKQANLSRIGQPMLNYLSNDSNSLDTGRDTSARSMPDASLFPRIVALLN
jgi:hypothetical protein